MSYSVFLDNILILMEGMRGDLPSLVCRQALVTV